MTQLCYYIYFRVVEQQAETLETRILAMQTELRETTGVSGRLMKKHGEPLLWMEVYEQINDVGEFERALAAAVEKFKLLECLQPGAVRKTECFT